MCEEIEVTESTLTISDFRVETPNTRIQSGETFDPPVQSHPEIPLLFGRSKKNRRIFLSV